MNVAAILEEYGIEGEEKDGEFLTLCPFHHDTHPSCSINLEKEVFRCFACDAKGSVINFLAAVNKVSRGTIQKHLEGETGKVTALSMSLVSKWHKNLLTSKKSLNHLQEKGISKSIIAEHLLGFDGKRITFPIFNKEGAVINVRRWLPHAVKAKILNIKGHGEPFIYPYTKIKDSVIIITEGELKALLLCQMSYAALTSTSGSIAWQDEWSSWFKNKRIYLCFDIDKSGQLGAQKTAQSLYRYTTEIYIIQLPLDAKKFPKGDITNYIVTTKHTKEDFEQLIEKAVKWEPIIYTETFDDKIYDVSLYACTEAKYFNKIIKTKVIVSAKDTAPFLIPYHIKVICTKDQEVCAFCKCFKQEEFKIDKRHPIILELVNIPNEKQLRALKKCSGIPYSCKVSHFKILEAMNVEELRLIPQIQISHDDSQHAVRKGYYIGHGIETNANYIIKARVCTEPDSQHAALVIFDAEPAIDNLTIFELKKDLNCFKPDAWTTKAIKEKLTALYLDLECNVTRIYKRPNLHFFYDLCYHSVLYLPFQGQTIKGWIEGLVLGDSGQGKSETIIQLQRHYKLGERIDVKACTVVGLIGGLQETAKRWFITWGIIPLNDKRLVVLEEIKGISPDVIGHLTEVRSSGIAEISKVEKARTNARVRLIWISNPRTDQQVLSYNFGIEAIKELIGNLEDIRRFDFAIIITEKDVDRQWINMSLKDRPKIKHRFSSDLCQQLILWGWSRKISQIEITEEATTEILRLASRMGSRYTSKIPLVESADQRMKIARLATALAVRTFSTEDNETLIVRSCHVKYVVSFLEELYSSSAFGYLDYSNLISRENSIPEKDIIKEHLRNLPFAKSVIKTFLNTQNFSIFDIIDWTELEIDDCRRLIGLLVRNNAIKKMGKGYVKNQAFIALLKELKMEDLENETRYTKASQEEF